MDLVESGAIFNFKPFNPQTSRDNGKDETLNSSSRSTSRSNSRFEELFLASPRAQELVSTVDQSLSFTHSRSRIISPNKQQSLLHDSLAQTPSSSCNPSKNTTNLTNSGLVNMLEFFKSGQKPRSQASQFKQASWFSPLKECHEEDSLRTQVTDVINKLRTPINRKESTSNEDGLCMSLNADSGYDDRQMHSCSDAITNSIVTRSSLRSITSNGPRQVSPGLTLELKKENNDEVSVPEPYVTEATVQEVDVKVGEHDQQSEARTEHIESTQKESCESVDESMDCNTVSECDIPEIPDTPEKRLVKDETKEPIPAQSPSPVKPSQKAHHLFGWHIKAIKAKNDPSIIVEGQRREDPVGELWHSTAIAKRISPFLVETKSKSQYVLKGKILAKDTIGAGFSKQFVEAFTYGFPSNWEQLVKEHFDSILDASSTKGKQPQKARKSSERQISVINRKPTTKTLKTPKNDGFKPIEVELKRTSSGRLIKPPLAWWRGQRILTDRQHNLTAIDPGGEEHTALSVGLYDFDLKLPKEKRASLLKSKIMTPKVAKYNVTKTSSPRKNQRTMLQRNKEKSQKRNMKSKVTSSLDSTESDSTDSTSYSSSKQTKDSSEKPWNSQTESDASSFPRVLRPKLVPSEESWRPSDSESTAKIPKSKKPQTLSNTRLKRTRKQHSELSTEESADNEEDEDDYGVDMVTKENVKRNISFSDDDLSSKSSQQKLPQKKESFTNLNRKGKNGISSNPCKPVKVVLEKNHQLTRSRKQMRDADNESDSTIIYSPILNDNDESDAVKSSKDVLRTNTQIKDSSKFRKPLGYAREYNRKNTEGQSYAESSSEENRQQRRSLRTRKERNQVQRTNTSNYINNSRDHKEYDMGRTRKRNGFRKYTSVVEEEEDNSSSSDGEEAEAVANMLCNVRQRKVIAERQVTSGDATSDSDSDSPKKKTHNRGKTKKRSNQRSKPGNAQDKNIQQKNAGKGDEDDVDERDWNEDEIFRLSEALHSIPLSTARFWQKVSESVETRTAQECQLKYDKQLNLKPKKVVKPKEKPPKANQKVVAITGGVGTIKRKRELRQLIQQNNDGYEDDIFESTPYKNTKKKFKFFNDQNDEDSDAVENDDDDDDVNVDGDDEEHNQMDFKTPSSRTPSSRYRPLGPVRSSVNTPGSDLISPSLLHPVNREGMDHYIHRMKQSKKGVGQYKKRDKMKVVKTSTPKKKVTTLIPKTDASIFDVQEVLEQDSDEESDYYWSDE